MGDKKATVQTINGLMRHLRNDCNIHISGSKQKQQLINYGYYHGYKGYRFYVKSKNIIEYTDFNQIISVIEYDNALKSLFYEPLMSLEMFFKNNALEEICKGCTDVSFDGIYKEKMTDFPNDKKLKIERLLLKDRIHHMLSERYRSETNNINNNNNRQKASMVCHFYDRGDEVPIWAIFEIITLGEFATFIKCLNKNVRNNILRNLQMDCGVDTNSMLIPNALYIIKSLCNAVAHNNIIFDCRFLDRNPSRNILEWIKNTTGINNIKFTYLIDYLILLVTMLSKVGYEKTKIEKHISLFEKEIDKLYNSVPNNIYTKIVSTSAKNKINQLKIITKI